MYLLVVVFFAAVVLLAAYRWYGGILVRFLALDAAARTPAEAMRDNVDYEPIEPKFLLSQHFSAIAAAGPVVGPILAGLWFGWAPALAWILIGSILIGGVHDMTALVASIRHRARSIAEIVRMHMTRRSYVVFLAFVWISLVYIIVAFTDVTATSFIGDVQLENGDMVRGGGIATSSMLYLALPIIMGVLLRFTRLSVGVATVLFVPLVALAIWVGQYIPFDVAHVFAINPRDAQKAWDVALLFYCLIASVVPMWLLLQPRGHLGGYFLYAVLAGSALGVVFGGRTVEYPAFLGWETARGETLFPILFITIACGACSGFHAIIASGTTSKQLRCEPDAKPIAYGAMLLEAMVAVVSLSCVMMWSRGSPVLQSSQPNFIYAVGVGSYLGIVGIPASFGVPFGLMAFTTFVYDTLDVCTRLGRYILQELFGWHSAWGRWAATGATAGTPLLFLLWQPNGSAEPAWRVFWGLFGASNQLLAALTLLGVTVWLWRTRRAAWVWFVTGLPTVWMYSMSMWALLLHVSRHIDGVTPPNSPIPYVALVLIVLGLMMAYEAAQILIGSLPQPPTDQRQLATAST